MRRRPRLSDAVTLYPPPGGKWRGRYDPVISTSRREVVVASGYRWETPAAKRRANGKRLPALRQRRVPLEAVAVVWPRDAKPAKRRRGTHLPRQHRQTRRTR